MKWTMRKGQAVGPESPDIALDVATALSDLAALRPVFHSEADLQHELAIGLRDLGWRIRLEHPIAPCAAGALDIVARNGDAVAAVELKYVTRGLEHRVGDEVFRLKNHAAHDHRRYDIVKDIMRLEDWCRVWPRAKGVAVVITNNPLLWRGPQRAGTADVAFTVADGDTLTGRLTWGASAKPGTTRGRAEPLTLRGAYRMAWRAYSQLDAANGEFRSLIVSVGCDQD